MKFYKEKMINRLKAEGRGDAITPDILAIMDNLDGQDASASCWARQVHGEPVFWCVGKDGKGYEVNEADCA